MVRFAAAVRTAGAADVGWVVALTVGFAVVTAPGPHLGVAVAIDERLMWEAFEVTATCEAVEMTSIAPGRELLVAGTACAPVLALVLELGKGV